MLGSPGYNVMPVLAPQGFEVTNVIRDSKNKWGQTRMALT